MRRLVVILKKKRVWTCDKEDFFSLKLNSEKDWLRTNIFYTVYSIERRFCNLIINGGSCENVISQEVVNKLKLTAQDHPQPYKLYGFKKGSEVKVTKCCLVPFSIQKKYFYEVWCDGVPMDACHILLGKPWQKDRQTMHGGKKKNTSCKLPMWLFYFSKKSASFIMYPFLLLSTRLLNFLLIFSKLYGIRQGLNSLTKSCESLEMLDW